MRPPMYLHTWRSMSNWGNEGSETRHIENYFIAPPQYGISNNKTMISYV